MGKILNNQLEILSHKRNIYVKIGSVGGCGFWYCGKLNASAIREIELIAKQYNEKEKRQLAKAKAKKHKIVCPTVEELEFDISTSLLNRKVVEMVDGISPDEPNTKVIYVEGFEKGNYWTIKSYIKDHLPPEERRYFNERLPRLSESDNWL